MVGEWNKKFQNCLENLKKRGEGGGAREKMEGSLELMQLNEDFLYASRIIGKIIISEVLIYLFFK